MTLAFDTKFTIGVDYSVKEVEMSVSKNRRAFFIVGSEGSGTHMMTDALRAAGCHEEPWHGGYADDYKFGEMPDLFVFRRSLPHAHKWPRTWDDYIALENAGYDVHVVFTIRDFYASARSVIHRGYSGSLDDCYYNQSLVFSSMGRLVDVCNPVLTYSTYESFCLNPKFRQWLFEERFNLPYPADFQIHYANPQYYED